MTATTPLTFRPATTADIPAVLGLVQSAYRGDDSRQGWTHEADLLDGIRADPAMVADLIGRPDSRLLLGHAGTELVACCHVERRADGTGYFGMFAVRPDRQGGGIGRAVLAEAERQVTGWGCRLLRMTTLSVRADLIAWYRRRGYRRTDRTEPFPYGDERFGIPKRPDLEFAELVKDLGEPV